MTLDKTIEKIMKGTTALLVAGTLGISAIFGVNVHKNHNIRKNINTPFNMNYQHKSKHGYHSVSMDISSLRLISGLTSYEEAKIRTTYCSCIDINNGDYKEGILIVGNIFGNKKEYGDWDGDKTLDTIRYYKDIFEVGTSFRNSGVKPIKDYEEENEFFKQEIERFEEMIGN